MKIADDLTRQNVTRLEEEIKSKIKELLPPLGYEKLHQVFQQAMEQAAFGKGKERHASGEPFEEQPICEIGRWVGFGGPLFQAIKKAIESIRLLGIKGKDAAKFELLGAMNFLAAAVILLDEPKPMAIIGTYPWPIITELPMEKESK